MKVVFVGTSGFAVPSLEAVIASPHGILAVITQPDRPRGRGREMSVSPVKQVALAHSIPLLQPERISSADSVEEIKSLGSIGAMIVVAYGQKIPGKLLEWPECGVVNVHGSILPMYRGAAPIQRAVINGEQTTGVTTMLMDEGWDTGDILLQESCDILPDENAGELGQRLALLGAGLLVRTLDGLERGTITPIPQSEDLASLAPSLDREAGSIDWSAEARSIVNLIRGCTPRPGAYTRSGGGLLKVSGAAVHTIDDAVAEPGVVVETRERLVVAAGSGTVELVDVQPEGRKVMAGVDFARGARLRTGDRLFVESHELGVNSHEL